MKTLTMALLWLSWCVLHSALISLTVTAYLKRNLRDGFRYYRLVYNALALITLIPVALYAHSLQTQPLFSWQGPWRVGQGLLLAASLFLFMAGARHYDLLTFLGARQLKQRDSCLGLTETRALDTRGILGAVRHPWYTGGMMVIWARDLDLSAILTNLILTGYFIVGTLLEERKLSIEFPAIYKDYRQKVSIFFPYQWFKSKWKA